MNGAEENLIRYVMSEDHVKRNEKTYFFQLRVGLVQIRKRQTDRG